MFNTWTWLDFAFVISFITFVIAYVGMEIVYKKYKTMPAPSSIPMRNATIKALTDYIPPDQPRDKKLVILEPGAGWGALAIAASKAYKNAPFDIEIRAYEVSHAVFAILWLRSLLTKGRVKPILKSFYDDPFTDIDAVIVYQTIDLLKSMKPKFEAELPSHAMLFCNTFYIDGWAEIERRPIYKLIYDFNVYIYKKDQIKGANI